MGLTGFEIHSDSDRLFLLIDAKQWKTIEKILQHSPDEARTTHNIAKFYDNAIASNVTPLHEACRQQAPPSIIELLHRCDPQAILQPDSAYRRTPLHIAIMFKAPIKSIYTLMKINPSSTSIRDLHGRLPIHYACKSTKDSEHIIRYILKVFPEATDAEDDNGFLALHVACGFGSSMSMIRMLLRASPETIFHKTSKGSTPVSCAKKAKQNSALQMGEESWRRRKAEVVSLLEDFGNQIKQVKEDEGSVERQGPQGAKVIPGRGVVGVPDKSYDTSCDTSVSSGSTSSRRTTQNQHNPFTKISIHRDMNEYYQQNKVQHKATTAKKNKKTSFFKNAAKGATSRSRLSKKDESEVTHSTCSPEEFSLEGTAKEPSIISCS